MQYSTLAVVLSTALVAFAYDYGNSAATPTVANIRDELSALRSAGVQADIDAFIADVDVNPEREKFLTIKEKPCFFSKNIFYF